MSLERGRWLLGALVATTAVVCGVLWVGMPAARADGPIARILAPGAGFKLRQGRMMDVRVQVAATQRPLQRWTLSLLQARRAPEELASGNAPVADATVATVAAEHREPGETYDLALEARDTEGATTTDRVSFLIPDPQYALIPLEAGDMTVQLRAGLDMDGSGTVVAMGGDNFGDVWVLETTTGRLRKLHISLSNTDGFRLSRDGRRLAFTGSTPHQLSLLRLDSLEVRRSPVQGNLLLSTDETGRRVAFQGVDRESVSLQYYLYDDATGETRQLTRDPEAANHEVACPRLFGGAPLISADGSTVEFVSSATLGLVPDDPPACHVFVYDVPSATLRHVRAFPRTTGIDLPALSDDGRWLSFLVLRTQPPFGVRDFGVLLDLDTGGFMEPVAGVTDFTTYDALITGDASAVVLSTQDDLDPRVGNPDHDLELFRYDRASGRAAQITETTGGIGRSPGGCPPYQAHVSRDGGAVAFFFVIGSGAVCTTDGPQRNEADGFTFRRVRAVRKRAGNRSPMFEPPSVVRARAGEPLSIDFSAQDPDGDAVVFFAQVVGTTDIPARSHIEDQRNGHATFTWNTKLEDAGVRALRVGAFDEGGGEVVHEVTLAVCSRFVSDGTVSGVVQALFESDPPAPCRDADRNRDGAITAADVAASAGK